MTLRRPLAAAAAAVALLAPACGGDDPVPPERVAAAVASRNGLTPAEGRCVAAELDRAYTDDELRLFVEDGLAALPSTRWSDYLHSVVACGLGAELGVEGAG